MRTTSSPVPPCRVRDVFPRPLADVLGVSPTPYLHITYKGGSAFDCMPIGVSGNGDVRLSAREGSAPDRPLDWQRVARIEFDLGATSETVDLDPAAIEALGLAGD